MTILSSTLEVNDDPAPFVWSGHSPEDQARADTNFFRTDKRVTSDYFYRPRPEFSRAHPGNPILAEFRLTWKGQPDMLEMAQEWLDNLDGDPEAPFTYKYPLDRIVHANRVLSRFVAVYS